MRRYQLLAGTALILGGGQEPVVPIFPRVLVREIIPYFEPCTSGPAFEVTLQNVSGRSIPLREVYGARAVELDGVLYPDATGRLLGGVLGDLGPDGQVSDRLDLKTYTPRQLASGRHTVAYVSDSARSAPISFVWNGTPSSTCRDSPPDASREP